MKTHYKLMLAIPTRGKNKQTKHVFITHTLRHKHTDRIKQRSYSLKKKIRHETGMIMQTLLVYKRTAGTKLCFWQLESRLPAEMA